MICSVDDRSAVKEKNKIQQNLLIRNKYQKNRFSEINYLLSNNNAVETR